MTTQDKINILKVFTAYSPDNSENKEYNMKLYNNAKQWLAELEKQKELVNIVKSFVE